MATGDNLHKGFLIVGVGASAGGLDAFQRFLNALPEDFGFALVFIQHLSSKHKSLLGELLSARRPSLVIQQIYDGLKIQPGRLYLAPPGREVRLQNGFFQTAVHPEGLIHLPIDEFLSSLAEDAAEHSIAVILSGAGTDGSRGCQAVRSVGGTVFIQDPETAEFNSMPLAAIATGRADAVLAPEDIAKELLKIQGIAGAVVGREYAITVEEYDGFFRILQEKIGARFTHFKKNVVSRRIRRRMYLHGFTTVKAYLDLISADDSEASLLASDLMIGVTSFFRDRLAWKVLNTEAVRKIAAENTNLPIRVWTPATATGEEAYSIAMMLLRELALAGRKRDIYVFATDVNDRALERAREGRYPASITADVPQEYIQKYFTSADNGNVLVINKDVRECVVFARQDLLTDPPFSKLDLIICRNFLIYLEPEAQEKCMTLFHYALNNGGYLFLGNAETVGRKSAFFKSIGRKQCRIYRKLETKSASRMPISVPYVSERAVAQTAKQAQLVKLKKSVTEVIQEKLLEEYAPASVAIDQNYEIIYHNGPTNRYLRQPRGVPTQNLLELVPENLRSRIRGALFRSGREERPVVIRTSVNGDDDKKRHVTLRITKAAENLSIMVFQEKSLPSMKEAAEQVDAAVIEETAIHQLESELSATKADLQSHIEQLKSLNEELQSSNEELQAANEEMETSREELQSLNEELVTVNSQLQGKIEEQDATNNDLNNFLASTNLPTVFLDHRFRVKRFTPAMSRLLQLIPSDVGRPLVDLSQEKLGSDLIADARKVLDKLAPIKKEMKIDDTWYVRATLPYRTADDRIEGVVITYSDVTELKKAEERSRHLASFPQLNPNPVMEVDAFGNIIFANPSTERILESLGLDKRESPAFLPKDLNVILEALDKNSGSTVYREVLVKDSVFSENIHLIPQFKVARIYAYDITERKRAEAEIQRLAHQRQIALDAAHLGWWQYSPITRIADWDDGFKAIFGVSSHSSPNDEILAQIIHPADLPGLWAKVEAALNPSDPQVFTAEYRINRPDGAMRWIEAHGIASFDGEGEKRRAVNFVGTVADITDRKRAEDALQESERKFSLLFQKASFGASLATMPEGAMVDVNEEFLRIFGFAKEDIIGKTTLELGINPDAEARARMVAELMECGYVRDVETRLLTKSGEERIFLVSIIVAEFGGRKYNVSTIVDITDRKRAEESLRESQERFRSVLDNSRDVIYRLNVQTGCYEYISPSVERVLGFSPNDVMAWDFKTAQSMVHPDDLPVVLAAHARMEQTGEGDVEFRQRTKNGDYRWLSNRLSLSRDSAGQPLYRSGNLSDITERKLAEEERERLLGEVQRHVAELDAVFKVLPYLVSVHDKDGKYLRVNQAVIGLFGFDPTTATREEIARRVRAHFPDGRPLTPENMPSSRALSGETINDVEYVITNERGEEHALLFNAIPLKLGKQVYGAVFSQLDITARKRAEEALVRLNKALKALSDSSQAVIRAEDEQEYLNDVCQIIVDDCGYSMVWIGFSEHDDAKSVRPAAYSGFEEGYLETLKLTWADTERGQGPTGTAIRTGNVAVCRNMMTDPAFTPWREEAIKRGYASSIVFPLRADGRVFGAITMYSKAADPFSEDEIRLLTELTDNVAYSIGVLRLRDAQIKAEEALRRAADFDEAALRSLGEGLYTIDDKGLVTFMNPAAEKLFGWTFAELRGKKMHDMTHHHYRDGRLFPAPECAGFQVLTTGRPLTSHEDVFIHKDGTFFDVIYSITPLRESGGKIIGLVVVFSDITERKKAETALFESEERYRSIIENASEGIWIGDFEGRTTFVNERVTKMIGYSPEELLGKTVYDLMDEDARAIARLNLEQRQQGYKNSYELKFIRKGGSTLWAIVGATPLHDKNGNVIASMAMITDITERKLVEEKTLHQQAVLTSINRIFREALTAGSEEELGRACLSISEELTGSKFGFIAEIGRNGLLHDIAISDFGWDLCTMKNKTDRHEPVGTFKVNGLVGRVIIDERPFFTNDPYSHHDSIGTPEGHPRLTAFLGIPLIHRGKTIGLLALGNREGGYRAEDVETMEPLATVIVQALMRKRTESSLQAAHDELKQRAYELEAVNRELEDYSYTVSHDLKSPLRSIDGFARALLEDYGDKLDSTARDYLERVNSAALRMNQLIQAMLDMARLTRRDLNEQSVDLSSLAKVIAENLRKQDPARDVEFIIADKVSARGDNTLLQAVLENLMHNAWKFTGKHKTATIEFGVTMMHGHSVYFIKDDGAGFDMQFAGKLFMPFNRFHAESEFAGLGIGLATANRIILRHNGRLWAESAPEKGATFYFTLS